MMRLRCPCASLRGMSLRAAGVIVWLLGLAAGGVRAAGPAEPPGPFMLGADVSWVPQQEAEGRRFSDGGVGADPFAILRAHGFNWIRLRLFHTPTNPGGYSARGYCDLPRTVAAARRAKAAGFRLLLDFHYSDTWADPQHQWRPAAWRDLDDAALARAVGDYTRETLAAFRAAGVAPDMVQIGNEITNGFLWREGGTNHLADFDPFCACLRAGIAAARAAAPPPRVMLHLDCGGSNAKSRWFLDRVLARGVDFDVLGLSYYPRWHGPIERLRENTSDLAARYRKPIVVVEYSAPTLREVNDLVRAIPEGRGLGTFIWEPTGWPHGDNPALFTPRGATKPEIDLYPAMARDYAAAPRPSSVPPAGPR